MFQPGEMVAQYEILEPAGEGGFARIYKARSADGAIVALKFPMIDLIGDIATYERFLREFKIGQKLNHPAFAHMIALNDSPNGPYIVQEFVEGVSLRSRFIDHQPLTLAETLNIADQIADALAHIHARGVVHRDLKPDNIIIGPGGGIHILDMGNALFERARRVTWNILSDAMGTPDYIAPEQIQGKRGDNRTDIYALGIILYEMLTGSVPFQADNPFAAMNLRLTSTPVSPHSLNSSVPPGLAAIVMKCIRRDPDERYERADQLLHDLKHHEELDQSEFAFPPEKTVRAHITDRQIYLLGAIIGVAFIVVATLIILAVYWIHQHR
jgi:serine/threonine protein kinase